MDKKEIFEYLKENLKLKISSVYCEKPWSSELADESTISLYLEDKEISSVVFYSKD